MQYARCKCGAHESWSSGMPPILCTPCRKCGTVPASGPDCHEDPVPHDFRETTVDTDAGPAALSRCLICRKTRAQIAAYDVKYPRLVPPLRPRGPGEAVGTPGTFEAGPPPPRPPTPPTPPLGRMPW